MKVGRHGRAKILSQEEIELLFSEGFTLKPLRDRAIFAICLYTACRINECVSLLVEDVFSGEREVRDEIILRKEHTKGKLATRTIPVIEELRIRLLEYGPPTDCEFLFPGRSPHTHFHPDSASWVLRQACKRVGIEGVSTHSFRRTALTQMSNAGIPLRIIQEVSGHRKLDELYSYLEVMPEQVRGAVASLSMLAPGSNQRNEPALTTPSSLISEKGALTK